MADILNLIYIGLLSGFKVSIQVQIQRIVLKYIITFTYSFFLQHIQLGNVMAVPYILEISPERGGLSDSQR